MSLSLWGTYIICSYFECVIADLVTKNLALSKLAVIISINQLAQVYALPQCKPSSKMQDP